MAPWLDLILGISLLALFLWLCFLAGRHTRARDVKKLLGDSLFIRPHRPSDD